MGLLKPGDKIGLIASSEPIVAELDQSLDKAMQFFQDLGLCPILGNHVRSSITSGCLVDPKLRAKDFNDFAEKQDIKAIINLWGGYNSHEILEYVNWDLLKQNKPLVIGASDFTFLLNAVYATLELVTYHWINAIWLGLEVYSGSKKHFVDYFIEGHESPNLPLQYSILRKGHGEGIIIGGNLETIERMIGTPYLPNHDTYILVLEDSGKSFNEIRAMINHLQMSHMLSKCKGIVLGQLNLRGESNLIKSRNVVTKYILEVTKEYGFPIVKTTNIGHETTNVVIPIGANAMLNTDTSGITKLQYSQNKSHYIN